MDRHDFSFRLIDTLASLLKERHGEIARVLRELGLGESYLRSLRRPDHAGGVKLRRLGALLEVSEIEPALIWARAFPEGADPLLRFRSEARLQERRLTTPKVLDVVRENHACGSLRDTVHTARESEIDEVWAERLTSPSRAGRRASMLARYAAERPFVARALGVWAATLRMRGSLNVASVVLGVAIELAEGYPSMLAELAQRAAYVLSDGARFQDAVGLAEAALVGYCRMGDAVGVGRALVDNGTFLDRCGEPEQAVAAYTASLGFLPESESFYRYAAHQGLALVNVSLDRLRLADHHLRQALDVRVILPEIEIARLFWLRARISRARGEADQALIFFEQTLCTGSPLGSAWAPIFAKKSCSRSTRYSISPRSEKPFSRTEGSALTKLAGTESTTSRSRHTLRRPKWVITNPLSRADNCPTALPVTASARSSSPW